MDSSTPLRKTTLVLLRKDNHVLLAMKKRGFGEGRWNGVGGKPEPGEDITDAAVRECQEEIGVTPRALQHSAELTFIFDNKLDWNQQVMVYLSDHWEGEPIETEEMMPKWFKISDIPYSSMWEDDKYWLPSVLDGKFITATFKFDENQKLISHDLSSD